MVAFYGGRKLQPFARHRKKRHRANSPQRRVGYVRLPRTSGANRQNVTRTVATQLFWMTGLDVTAN